MRRTKSLLVILALFAASQIAAVDVRASRVHENSTTQQPEVTAVRLKGKKLWVIGQNFSEGAVILINGEPVGTISDPDNPEGLLFAKRGGKRIPPEKTVAISVQNGGGVTSQTFDFFSGLTITIEDGGKTFNLKVGDKFQVLLKADAYEWAVTDYDANLIPKLSNEPAPAGSQGIFQAVKSGRTQLGAVGELPCHKSTPPCLAPSLLFEVTVIIE